jgi:eukaryotic-like serine/threonine-protein kinase
MVLKIGMRLGPYEILSALGAGGMGEVYKANDTRLDRAVAIKVLREHFANDSDRRARFEREARAVSKLNHPNICTLYDVGHDNGTDFLVVEFLDGESLAERLTKGALPIDQALTIAIQIAGALDAAHRAGIVHRDLKPANVMLTKTGAKLLDFGIARMAHAAEAVAAPQITSTLTGDGALLGTVHYMAPEQLEGREADARSDIFAFGAVLYEMLTGRRAFAGETLSAVAAAVLESQPIALKSIQPLVASDLEWFVTTCLAKDPDDRWQNARDLRRNLQRIAEHATATGERTTEARPQVLTRMIFLALSMTTIAAVVGIWMARRQPDRALQPFRLDVITPATADPTSFALSPDGRQLVFAATIDGQSKLWLRSLDDTTARPLTGTDDASGPFWAPDGEAIAFFAAGKLRRFDLSSRLTRVVCDAPGGLGGTWNREDVILFASNTPNSLMRVSGTGGTPTPVPRGAPGKFQMFPSFLPDGRRFLFVAGPDRAELQGVYLASLDSPKIGRLMEADTQAVYVPPGYLMTMKQGLLLAAPFDAGRGIILGEAVPIAQGVGVDAAFYRGAFSASTDGLLAYRELDRGTQLTWVARNGTVQGTVGPIDKNLLLTLELAPDDRRAAVMRNVLGNVDVWLVDTKRAVAERLTSDESADGAPVWSPDGRQIVFGSNRNGAYDLLQKSAIGRGDEQPMLSSSDDKMPVDWSRDGHFLLYVDYVKKAGKSELWVLPVGDETAKSFPAVPAHFAPDEGQFSPDGRWIAFRSLESEQPEIYVHPFQGPGRPWLVSAGGGSHPRWRRDGRELFYIRADGMLMSVAIGPSERGQDLKIGTAIPLFRTHFASMSATRAPYAVSQDGQRFLMAVAVEAASPPITIVQNWAANLRR